MNGPLLHAACPRCGGGFECGASSGPAGHCDCFGIRLSEPLRERLARDYPGQCLCLRCLRELIAADDQGAREAAQA
jgi:hypothetical protein